MLTDTVIAPSRCQYCCWWHHKQYTTTDDVMMSLHQLSCILSHYMWRHHAHEKTHILTDTQKWIHYFLHSL